MSIAMFSANRIGKSGSSILRALALTPSTSAFGFNSKRQFVVFNSAQAGPPPVSIEDLYGLTYRYEPAKKTKDRSAEDTIKDDIQLNEVMLYANGGRNLPKDNLSEAFILNIKRSKVVFSCRDATLRPEILQVLNSKGGSNELPQLWVKGKLMGTGKDLGNFEKVWELTEAARRPWPRTQKAYYNGFPGYLGVTTSTECINRPTPKE